MARSKNRQPTNDVINADTIGDSAEIATIDAPDTITMDNFMSRPDKSEWLTIKNAVSYMGLAPDDSQKIRNAIRNRPEFKPSVDGTVNVLSVTIEGYDLPPLTYARRSALDTYRENVNSGNGTGRQRGGAKRWVVRLTADQHKAYTTGDLVLTVGEFPLDVASTPKARKGATASADTSNDSANMSDAPAESTPSDDPNYDGAPGSNSW